MTLRARILCRVVDNFGDAGVCWRLARQLQREHGWQVCLVIDRPEILDRLGARGNADLRIERWPHERLPAPGHHDDVVVSAFGAQPPPALRARLAGEPRRPLWVQLEYLSAERWIAGCHGLRSTKPSDAAVEHFFYPGYDEDTGGLLRERDLFARRDAFDDATRQRWLLAQGIEPQAGERLATLFCYPDAPVAEWLALLVAGAGRWRVLVPEGVADAALARCFGEPCTPGRTLRRGALTVQRIAFVSQDDYDRLLWSADLNFVRGEDSWVRAQWAARPFVWQPYVQAGGTHELKLRAFLERMQAGVLVDAMMLAWSGCNDLASAWPAFEANLATLEPGFREWSARLGAQTDLATRLAAFCADRL